LFSAAGTPDTAYYVIDSATVGNSTDDNLAKVSMLSAMISKQTSN